MRYALVLSLTIGFAVLVTAAQAAPGDLDPSFGTDGRVTTALAGSDAVAEDVVIQPDGKLVVAGWIREVSAGSSSFLVARYDTDGTLDGSFGNGGLATANVGSGSVAKAVALQPDGRIVAAGQTTDFPGTFGLARFNADGSLDASFGSEGTVITNVAFNSSLRDVAVQTDGKIVVGGGNGDAGAAPNFALVRYLANGTLDATFGSGGVVSTNFGHGGSAEALAIQPDGKIVEVGHASLTTYPFDALALVRFNANGTLDADFGTGGKVLTTFQGGGSGSDVVLASGGKILAAGWARTNTGDGGFGLARYEANGALDTTFGDNGVVYTNFGGSFDVARTLAIAEDGAIVAAGHWVTPSFSGDFALARYTQAGVLDESFGTGGKVTTDFDGASEAANAVVIQDDGRIVAAGVVSPAGPAAMGLARYSVEVAPDVVEGNHDGYAGLSGLTGSAACAAYGWAFNAARPQYDLTVRILIDGREAERAVARDFREDLLLAGIGDGTAAFYVDISAHTISGVAHEVRAQALDPATGAWVDLGETKLLTCTEIYGNHDAQEGVVAKKDCYATGWAFDAQTPATRVQVRIRVNDKVVAETTANQLREDVRDAGFGDGYSGWTVPLVGRVQPGKASVIRAEARDTQAKRLWYPLWSSDKALTCEN